ncbi:MAG: four-carbon acid sugar kinase family protein, partial [Janthinobacterium lividum]
MPVLSSVTTSGTTRSVTVVLDDDPTGTQEVSGVPVLLRRDRARLIGLLRDYDAVFVLTNTRAVPEGDAAALIAGLVEDVRVAEVELGVRALVVQRGDSTLRGHVFAEVDAVDPRAVVVYCPAFPAGGRRTVGGVHEVLVEGTWLNAADTEFAQDPVFAYSARSQVEFVAEKGRSRVGVSVPAAAVADAVRAAAPGTVVLPDASTDADIAAIAEQLRGLERDVVVRCAAPLAAFLARAKSTALLSDTAALGDVAVLGDVAPVTGSVLVVVGSHTGAAAAQLARLTEVVGPALELSTAAAQADPVAAGEALAGEVGATSGVVVLASERTRLAEHATLAHGAAVMTALTNAVQILVGRDLVGRVAAVVAKGGITSAEIARTGLGADVAWVVGQL